MRVSYLENDAAEQSGMWLLRRKKLPDDLGQDVGRRKEVVQDVWQHAAQHLDFERKSPLYQVENGRNPFDGLHQTVRVALHDAVRLLQPIRTFCRHKASIIFLPAFFVQDNLPMYMQVMSSCTPGSATSGWALFIFSSANFVSWSHSFFDKSLFMTSLSNA